MSALITLLTVALKVLASAVWQVTAGKGIRRRRGPNPHLLHLLQHLQAQIRKQEVNLSLLADDVTIYKGNSNKFIKPFREFSKITG